MPSLQSPPSLYSLGWGASLNVIQILLDQTRARSHFLTCRDYGAAAWLDRRSGETMQVLTDAQWAKFEAAIAAANIRGARPRREDRRTIEAIIWRLDNGAKWRSIPAELGGLASCLPAVPPLGCARGVGQDHGLRRGPGGAAAGLRLH